MFKDSRWVRLERYARWKQNRIRLDKLPPDVISIVCQMLPNECVQNLLAALQGHSKSLPIGSVDDTAGIPVEMRRSWLRRMAYDHVESQLGSLAPHTCWYCNDVTLQVHAFADWSLFQSRSRRSRCPIAEYGYVHNNGRMEWQMRVNRNVLTEHVDSLCKRQCCASRISLYMAFIGGRVLYLVPDEMTAFLILVFPHFLLSHM